MRILFTTHVAIASTAVLLATALALPEAGAQAFRTGPIGGATQIGPIGGVGAGIGGGLGVRPDLSLDTKLSPLPGTLRTFPDVSPTFPRAEVAGRVYANPEDSQVSHQNHQHGVASGGSGPPPEEPGDGDDGGGEEEDEDDDDEEEAQAEADSRADEQSQSLLSQWWVWVAGAVAAVALLGFLGRS